MYREPPFTGERLLTGLICFLVARHHPLGLDVSSALNSGPEVQDVCGSRGCLNTITMKQFRVFFIVPCFWVMLIFDSLVAMSYAEKIPILSSYDCAKYLNLFAFNEPVHRATASC